MASQAQVEANRANAAKSTGPRTSEGKAAVSQNAVKHGLLAEQVVIKDGYIPLPNDVAEKELAKLDEGEISTALTRRNGQTLRAPAAGRYSRARALVLRAAVSSTASDNSFFTVLPKPPGVVMPSQGKSQFFRILSA